MTWRERFNMSGPPLPRDAAGETFFDQGPHFQRLARVFAWLTAEPGIGVVTGEPGVGKTSAMRHLCRALPLHEHRVVYLGDTTVKPLDLYRMLATELGLRPSPRAQIVGDIKRALVTLVDERGVVPIVILDDAQALRDDVLHELHGLTSLDFDGREYLTVWLVGHPRLDRRLRLQQHAALAQRVVAYTQLSATADPALFGAMLDHALAAAAAPPGLIARDARELLLSASRGIPRLVSHLLRISLILADERGQARHRPPIVTAATALLHLEPPTPAIMPPTKPRFDRGPRSRR
jgi:MSHA biogenesis protein MshM